MRELKSRKRNDDREERTDLREKVRVIGDKVREFVDGHQQKVMILAGAVGAVFIFSLGMLTVHMMNRTTVTADIEQQQVAEVETTGEIIKITSDEGLTIAAEETKASQDEGGQVPDASKEETLSDKATEVEEALKQAAKANASVSRGKNKGAKTYSGSSQGTGSKSSDSSTSASGSASGTGSSAAGTSNAAQLDPSNTKLDLNSDGKTVRTEETYLVFGGDGSDTTFKADKIGEAPTKSESEEQVQAPSDNVSSEQSTSEDKPSETAASESDTPSSDNVSTVSLPMDKKKLTVMVYMIGSSLETKSNLAANSIVTMLTGNIDTDKVNVILETGGTKKFHNISTADQKFDESKIQRWMLDGTKLKYLGDAGSSEGNSMTSKDTFESFLKYAKKNFPASRYEAVLWGQAGGPVNGFGLDELNSSSGQLSVANIAGALADTEMDLDLLLFDARLMGSMESSYALASHVDYMIASEDNEYAIGLNYSNWFRGISQDPSMSAIDQGKIILDDFIKDNKGKGEGMKNVVGAYSVIDLKALKRNTSDKLKNLAELLKAAEKTEDGRDHLRQAGKEAYEFAESYSYDLVDICSFLSAIEENYKGSGKDGIDYEEIRDAARSLKESVQKAVEVNRYVTPEDDGGVSGLTIYFPQIDTDAEKRSNMVSKYENLSFSTSYQQLIKQYMH